MTAVIYPETAYAEEGTGVGLMVRGRELPAKIVPMPFVPHRYYKKTKAN